MNQHLLIIRYGHEYTRANARTHKHKSKPKNLSQAKINFGKR